MRSRRRLHIDVTRRHRAIADVGDGQLEHRRVASLGEDPYAQGNAVLGIPGKLGGGEQTAVVLR